MIEMNGMMTTCPEGHYFHIPYTWFKPLVLDRSFTPAGYGEIGTLRLPRRARGKLPRLHHHRR